MKNTIPTDYSKSYRYRSPLGGKFTHRLWIMYQTREYYHTVWASPTV